MNLVAEIKERFQHMLSRPMMYVMTLGELEAASLAVLDCWELALRYRPAISVGDAYREARRARGMSSAGSLADWAGAGAICFHPTRTGSFADVRHGADHTEKLITALREIFERVKSSLPPLAQLADAAE